MTTSTPSPTDGHDVISVWAPRAIIAVVAAALVLVGIDVGGPVRSVVTALALLVAPGLAASLVMGPMSIEARVLISVIGSAVLLTSVAMVMALTSSWSPATGLWVVALVAIVLLLVPFLRNGGDASNGEASDNTIHSTAGTASQPHDDLEDEGGNEDDR